MILRNHGFFSGDRNTYGTLDCAAKMFHGAHNASRVILCANKNPAILNRREAL